MQILSIIFFRFLADWMAYLLFIPCTITYLLFAWDKHLAHYEKSRVPEFLLIMMSFLFGAFGALCAMVFFNHKTKHALFTVTVPILVFLQLALIVVIMRYLSI
jgi:uncharacterized membrane protein YsdA (DUF1294 family)